MSLRLLAGVSVLWFGLSMLFDGLTALVLPYLLLAGALSSEPGSIATLLGLATFAGIGLGMVVQPIVGRVSDASGSRVTPMLVGCAGAVGGLAVMGSAGGTVALVGGYLLAMLGANVAQAGQQALAPDRVPSAWRGRAAGTKGLLDLAGSSLAFMLVGALIADGGAADALIVIGAGLLATLVLALVLVPRVPRPAPGASLTDPGDGLARVVVARFLFLLAVYAVGRYFVLYLADRLGLGAAEAAAEAGMILGVLALLTAIASLPSGWAADRLGRRTPSVGGALVAAAGIGLLAVAPTSPLILVGGGLMAIGTALFGAGSWALLTDIAAPGATGRLMGLANLGTAGGAAAAGLLGPVVDIGEGIGAGIGFALLFVLASVSALAGGMLLADRPRPIAVVKEC